MSIFMLTLETWPCWTMFPTIIVIDLGTRYVWNPSYTACIFTLELLPQLCLLLFPLVSRRHIYARVMPAQPMPRVGSILYGDMVTPNRAQDHTLGSAIGLLRYEIMPSGHKHKDCTRSPFWLRGILTAERHGLESMASSEPLLQGEAQAGSKQEVHLGVLRSSTTAKGASKD